MMSTISHVQGAKERGIDDFVRHDGEKQAVKSGRGISSRSHWGYRLVSYI